MAFASSLLIKPTTAAAASFATASPSSSALHANAVALQDCTQGALAFFNSLRIPSTLVAGSTLATLFALSHHKSSSSTTTTRLEKFIAQTYHGLSLIAFLLSITAIVTTTTASTALLLGKHNGMATDVYHFMKREFNFEFVLTRWSFLTSLLAFLTATGGRCLIEFDLLNNTSSNNKQQRQRLGSITALLLGCVLSFLLSNVNTTLNCWPSLWAMTGEVARLVLARAKTRQRPLTVLALVSFSAALVLGMAELMRAVIQQQHKEEEQ